MTTREPLTRSSTRLCPGCNQQRPHGHFGEQVSLDHDPQRWRRIQHDHCQACRAGSHGAPGRRFQ